jgi:cytochrome c553
MRKTLLITACVVAAVGAAGQSQAAGNASAGKAKAEQCAVCHGDHGEGVEAPPIAGKAESELLQAMKDYKSGKRQDAAMKEVTSKLSDQDLADLAAYYAAMK